MNRTVHEVTFMAAKMKENGYRIPGQSESVAENIVQESQQAVRKEKVKKNAGTSNEKSMLIPETNWTQEQQRALEAAIVKYRKTAGGGDRWQKIANSVPEKSKEECLVRYKYLCELVKTQKKAEEEEEAESANMDEAAVPADEEELENEPEEATKPAAAPPPPAKKLSKREQRRRKRDLSSDEDSDDAYQYEIS